MSGLAGAWRWPGIGIGWETVMRAVRDTAARQFADQQLYTRQTRPCVAIGVDEKVMTRATRGRLRRFVTVIVAARAQERPARPHDAAHGVA